MSTGPNLLLNPFQKIAGWKALLLGIIIMVLTSAMALKAKMYFIGPMAILNASALKAQTVSHPFTLLLYQNLVCWLIFAGLLLFVGKVLQKHKTRVADYLGTIALARFPTLISTAYFMMIRLTHPSSLEVDFSKGFPVHFSVEQYLLTILFILISIWQAVVYFYAFRESSGLSGKKLVLGFLAAFIIADTITHPVATWFMN